MLGLGSSVATPPEGIRAQALVVNSFDELTAVSDKVRFDLQKWDITKKTTKTTAAKLYLKLDVLSAQ